MHKTLSKIEEHECTHFGAFCDIFSDDLQDSEHSHPVTRDVREILSSLPNIEISALTELPKNEKCGEHDLPCDHTSIFRSVTGWCNNLKDPNRGKAFTAFKRLLPTEYGDGMHKWGKTVNVCLFVCLFFGLCTSRTVAMYCVHMSAHSLDPNDFCMVIIPFQACKSQNHCQLSARSFQVPDFFRLRYMMTSASHINVIPSS